VLNGGKCGGDRPICKSCLDRKVPDQCRYELHPKSAKEEMVRKLQELHEETDCLEKAFSSAREKNVWLEVIMSSLKHGNKSNEMIRRIRRNDSYQSIAQWLRPSLMERIVQRGSLDKVGGEGQPSSRTILSIAEKGKGLESEVGPAVSAPSQDPPSESRDRMDIQSMMNIDC